MVSNEGGALKQLLKFGLVGVLNTTIGYLAFIFFLDYANYMASLVMAHIIGVTNSFIWNKYWTFQSRTNIIAEFVKFNSVYAVVLLANAADLFFLVDMMKLSPRLAQLVALPAVTIISFSGHKNWSFRKESKMP
jgi:putative flippase GtrA